MDICDDARGADWSYPSTVGLGNGTLLRVWYEVMRGSKPAVLWQTRWKLKG